MFYRGIRVEAFYESGLKDEVKFTLIHNYQNDYTNHSEINNLVRIKSIIIWNRLQISRVKGKIHDKNLKRATAMTKF